MTDSLKATFKKRPQHKHIYQQCMMLVMLCGMMAGQGERSGCDDDLMIMMIIIIN